MFPGSDRQFDILEPTVDAETGVVVLHYAAGADLFAEQWSIGPFPSEQLEAAQRAARILAVCGSTSYYKALYGATVHVEFDASTELLAGLLGPGLAEFRFENGYGIDHVPAISTGATSRYEPRASSAPAATSLVALGGGKDSIVAATALRQTGRAVTLGSINPKSPMTWSSQALALPLLDIGRRIDPRLFELNRQGAPNGHIPITAITSAGLVVAAVAHGFEEVVFANESSASVPTFFTADGLAVNHQYSKSHSFERLFRSELLRHGLPVMYYSAIRGLTELAVCKVMADLPPTIQESFTSCNTNFNLAGTGRAADDRWCGECSKCAFVFLSLAPFVGRGQLVKIFGKDLFTDPALEPMYQALAAEVGVRPLECIGTTEEVRWALRRAHESGEWVDADMLARLTLTHAESDGFDPFATTASDAPVEVQQALAALVDS